MYKIKKVHRDGSVDYVKNLTGIIDWMTDSIETAQACVDFCNAESKGSVYEVVEVTYAK